MRPNNIVTEVGIQTRVRQWWDGIPFLTSMVVIICGIIYFVCLMIGYDSFSEVCFSPSAAILRFQAVYRIYASVLFHGSMLHVMFNMMALVPLGSELERIMGSVRLLYIMVLLATSNAIFHILIALVVSHNPFLPFPSLMNLMNECAIGFSGILFSMIVMETSLSGVQSRSVFGLFNVPAKWYAFILLVLFQLLMTNVSLLGHLCGILSGFAYTYGLFNYLIPGSSFYSAIEASSWLSSCVRRPKFILCSGGNTSGYIPTHSVQNTASRQNLVICWYNKFHLCQSYMHYVMALFDSVLIPSNIWRNLSSWLPQRSAQATQDSSFPGRGRTLGSSQNPVVSAMNSDSNLEARLLDSDHSSNLSMVSSGERLSDGGSAVDNVVAATLRTPRHHQNLIVSDEHIQKLVSMGFEKTQVEVALAAADGDLDVAVKILMSQQG